MIGLMYINYGNYELLKGEEGGTSSTNSNHFPFFPYPETLDIIPPEVDWEKGHAA